jgi:predicted nucleic acid-binding protein
MNAVDTNILIYSCDSRDPASQAKAREVMGKLVQPVLLWQVGCEFIAASRKLADHGFTQQAAWAQLSMLINAWGVAIPRTTMLSRAQSLHMQEQVSFWNALLFAACLEAGVKRLYTEDVPGSSIPGLEIINPFA